MHLDTLIRQAARTLAEAGITTADLDARLLFRHLTGLSASDLVLRSADQVDDQVAASYRRLIGRRASRVPLHYLTGTREFWSLDFFVSPAVLIPRPETEFVLEKVLTVCRTDGPVRRALDLCTGSGVIAVVLARELACAVTAVDISPAALAVAWENVRRHGVTDLVDPVCGDLFAPLGSGR